MHNLCKGASSVGQYNSVLYFSRYFKKRIMLTVFDLFFKYFLLSAIFPHTFWRFYQSKTINVHVLHFLKVWWHYFFFIVILWILLFLISFSFCISYWAHYEVLFRISLPLNLDLDISINVRFTPIPLMIL